MNESLSYTAPTLARVLNIALIILMVILALIALLMIGSGIIMLTDSDPAITDKIGEGLKESGLTTPTKIAPFGGAIIALAYLYVASVVRGIVKTLINGNPFVEANISRLRKTWVIVALVEIFRIFLTGMTSAGEGSNSVALKTSLSAWFLVFVIATMAEVFRIGLELKRDQELTV